MKKIIRHLLLICLLILSSSICLAEEQMEKVTITCGADGMVRDFCSFPVKVELQGWKPGQYQVTLETVMGEKFVMDGKDSLSQLFLVSDNMGEQRQGFRKTAEFEIGEDGSGSSSIMFGMANYGGILRCEIKNGDKEIVYSQMVSVDGSMENEIFVGIVGEDTLINRQIRELHLTGVDDQIGVSFRTKTWRIDEFPADYQVLRHLQVILVDAKELEHLSGEQKNVLQQWKASGGVYSSFDFQDGIEGFIKNFPQETINRLIYDNLRGMVDWRQGSILEETPIRKEPPVQLYLGLLLIYIVTVGPGLYLFLRKKDRRALLFGWILIVSLVTAIAIGLLGNRNRIKAPFLVYDARYIQNEIGTTLGVNCAIRAPYNKPYTLYLDPAYEVIPHQPVANAYWDEKELIEQLIRMDVKQGEEKVKAQFYNLPVFQPMYFYLQEKQWQDKMLDLEIHYFDNKLSGYVTNLSSYPITDLQIYLGNEGRVEIGTVQSGETITLEKYEVESVSLEVWNHERRKEKAEQYGDWTEYLTGQYEETFYIPVDYVRKNKAVVLGTVEDGGLNFQLDSGYECYGKSILEVIEDIQFRQEDLVYDPWFARRGLGSDTDYTMELGEYIEKQGIEVRYPVQGELIQFTFVSRENDEEDKTHIFNGTIELFNWNTKTYDILENWDNKVLKKEELMPYVHSESGALQVRYGESEGPWKDRFGNSILIRLPAIMVVERR